MGRIFNRLEREALMLIRDLTCMSKNVNSFTKVMFFLSSQIEGNTLKKVPFAFHDSS